MSSIVNVLNPETVVAPIVIPVTQVKLLNVALLAVSVLLVSNVRLGKLTSVINVIVPEDFTFREPSISTLPLRYVFPTWFVVP